MRIRKTYIGKVNGISGVFCDTKPDGITLEQEINILYPDEGFILEEENTKEQFEYKVLDNIFEKNHYKEIKLEEKNTAQEEVTPE